METSSVCYILQPRKAIRWLKNRLEAVEKGLAPNVEHCLKQSCVSNVMFILRPLLFLFFEEGNIKISYIALLYCNCHFVLSANRDFSV